MSRSLMKYIATLILTAVSAYFGHILAEGLNDHAYTSAHQMALLAHHGDDCGTDGHHHEHGLSCDQWLCSGFSGVILGSEARIPMSVHIKDEPFVDTKSERFRSRTTEPPKYPPRYYSGIAV